MAIVPLEGIRDPYGGVGSEGSNPTEHERISIQPENPLAAPDYWVRGEKPGEYIGVGIDDDVEEALANKVDMKMAWILLAAAAAVYFLFLR
jgi:hypothetical protein